MIKKFMVAWRPKVSVVLFFLGWGCVANTQPAFAVSSNDVMAYADSAGSGTYKNEIAWLNWSNSSLSDGIHEGDSVTFPLACGTGTLTVSFSNVNPVIGSVSNSNELYTPHDMETKASANLWQLYNTLNTGEALYTNTDSAVSGVAQSLDFDMAFAMTLNGNTVSPDIIVAEAEQTEGSERLQFVTNGGSWSLIESSATLSGVGTSTVAVIASDGANESPVLLTEDATQLSISITSATGQQGIAVGLVLPCDHGDAQGYGDPEHVFAMEAASPPGTNSSPAGLKNVPNQHYLGAAEPDAEITLSVDDNVQGLKPADEDGVTFPTLHQGQSAVVTAVVNGTGGYLQGWIDWDGDGTFEDAEQVAENKQLSAGSSGAINLLVFPPHDAVTVPIAARFRWSTQQDLDATENAPDGEVEDYSVTVTASVTLPDQGSCNAIEATLLRPEFSIPTQKTPIFEGDFVRFENITTLNGQVIDLLSEVMVIDGLPRLDFFSVMNGDDAKLELKQDASQGLGTVFEVVVKHTFVEHNTTTPVSVSLEFEIDDLDLDTARRRESLTVRMSEMSAYFLNSATTLDVAYDGDNLTFIGTQDTDTGDPEAAVKFVIENRSDFTVVHRAQEVNPDDGIHGVGFVYDMNDFNPVPACTQKDYSDGPVDGSVAPDGTGVTAYGSAEHTIGDGLLLGNKIAHEDSSVTDADNSSDDGIVFPTLTPGTTVTVTADVTGTNGYLQGWIDWNGDGDFLDTVDGSPEQIIINAQDNAAAVSGNTSDQDTTTGQISIEVTVPESAITTETASRFRWSRDSGLNTTDTASDGEVEDYAVTISAQDLSGYSCTTQSDIWYANDESGSVDATEFKSALDFIYQVSDEFYHSASSGVQSSILGWASDADPTNIVMPLSATFMDTGDSGLKTTGTTVDGDGNGVRENYTTRVSTSGGTHLSNATQGLANRINAGNGHRAGVPQVAVILTDAPASQINNVASNGGGTAWEAAAANLRNSGPGGVRIALVLLAEAVDAYNNNAAAKATIDKVAGSTGVVVTTSTYAAAAEPLNGYIDDTVEKICSIADLRRDYSDAPISTTGYGDAGHSIVSGMQLGATVTKEDSDYDSAHADGDVDDGLSLNGTTLQDQVFRRNETVTLTATTSGNARLHGWIDWDRNGVFGNHPNEQIISEAANASGTRNITVTPPNDFSPGISYARFRYSTDDAAANPIGVVSRGEVEDYQVGLFSGYTVSGRVYNDTNVQGVNDPTEVGVSALPMVLYDTVNDVCVSTHTNANGEYAFNDVLPGNYQIYEASRESIPIPQSCNPTVAKDPSGYLSTTSNASVAFTLSNADITGIDFGDVKPSTFELDGMQTILPNTVALHPHVFTALSDGSVSFSISTETADPNGVSWGAQLLVDTNCDGQLDSGDTAMPTSIAVTFRQQVCILAKVLAPAGVTAGTVHTLEVQSNFTFGNGSSILTNDIQTHQDTTISIVGTTTESASATSDPVAGEGKLLLVKSVWNTSRNISGTAALPTETLRYTIVYKNAGNGPLNSLVIHDSVPTFTTLTPASMSCTNKPIELALCTVNDNAEGSLSWDWADTDVLLPGSEGSVSYEVMVE